MYQIRTTKQFEKDYKLCKKRGYKMGLINSLILRLEENGKIPIKHKPHKLSGNYIGFMECHIQPDWLLIWLLDNTYNSIELTRTGTHADLF